MYGFCNSVEHFKATAILLNLFVCKTVEYECNRDADAYHYVELYVNRGSQFVRQIPYCDYHEVHGKD